MNFRARIRSLRWQLPTSYAVIALLAVVALGITLLVILRQFYQQQEVAYLTDNATVLAAELAPFLRDSGAEEALQAQVVGYAFLIQTRIQIYDVNRQAVLADSGEQTGEPPSISVVANAAEAIADALGTVSEEFIIVVEEEEMLGSAIVTSERTITRTQRLPAQGSLYGFALGEDRRGGARSNVTVDVRISDGTGDLLGWIRLTEGPAYGQEILRSVALGWMVAGLVAVILAAVMGWWASRRLTKPLVALTAVTGQMAAGDLSARANSQQILELNQLAESYNVMASQVESTVDSLRRFTADAAHELHTPLTALHTDLHLLSADADRSTQVRVERARTQVKRLQELTEGLLELSQLEGELPTREKSIDLRLLLQRVAEIYASRAEQLGLAFDLVLPTQAVEIMAVESMIQRTVTNILENSLKFTPPPGMISLALQLEEAAIVIQVRDSGIGIHVDDLAQVLDRFHRGRNVADYPGSGLGLAIVHEIVEKHNGRIQLESGNWGTNIQIILPRS